MEFIRSERMTTPVPGTGGSNNGGVGAGAGPNGSGGNGAGGLNASTTTADLAGTGGSVGSGTASGGGGVTGAGGTLAPDPASMIDWDAFMKDFDWNFDPSLIETVVP